MKVALDEYKKYLNQLHRLEMQDLGESQEYRDILLEMDYSWRDLTGDERDEAAEHSVQLWSEYDKRRSL